MVPTWLRLPNMIFDNTSHEELFRIYTLLDVAGDLYVSYRVQGRSFDGFLTGFFLLLLYNFFMEP